tara:strand:- start:992 stop:1525 length:534 start_codon:yes stop_codon:yes gene_type:complete
MKEFRNLILLSPLVYVIHHFEEHIVFNFREWRLSYFLDNNPLSTEEVLLRLLAVMLIMIFLHSIKRNKPSAHIILFFLMTTQVVNACFHVFFSFYFSHFSPGAITGVLLYLPINYLIFEAALKEGLIQGKKEIGYLFILGACTFTLFELMGPQIMLAALIFSVIYYLIASKREAFNT